MLMDLAQCTSSEYWMAHVKVKVERITGIEGVMVWNVLLVHEDYSWCSTFTLLYCSNLLHKKLYRGGTYGYK